MLSGPVVPSFGLLPVSGVVGQRVQQVFGIWIHWIDWFVDRGVRRKFYDGI